MDIMKFKINIHYCRVLIFVITCIPIYQTFAIDALNGTVIYTSPNAANQNNASVSANQFSVGTGNDGLMVDFQVTINKSQQPRLLRLENGNPARTLEVYYENYTMKVRRFVNSSQYLDYVLYDSLFSFGASQEKTFGVQFYFSASFIWIETSAANMSKASPLFFGIGKASDMQPFLTGNASAKIMMGGNNYSGFTIPGVFKVYAYKYSDLRQDIPNQFNQGNGAGARVATETVTSPSPASAGNAAEEQALAIFPNPASGEFTVSFVLPVASPVVIEVTDLVGKPVYNRSNKFDKGFQQVKIEMPSTGINTMYVVIVSAPTFKKVQKVMLK